MRRETARARLARILGPWGMNARVRRLAFVAVAALGGASAVLAVQSQHPLALFLGVALVAAAVAVRRWSEPRFEAAAPSIPLDFDPKQETRP